MRPHFMRATLFFCLWLTFPLFTFSKDKLAVTSLKCDYKNNPLGVESTTPALSWIIISDSRNVTQLAYQIIVSETIKELNMDQGSVWNTKKVYSSSSIQVKYAGKKLVSGKTYFWKVRMWDQSGKVSPWSSASKWQMGLLSAADWNGAKWIGYEEMPSSEQILPFVETRGKFSNKNDILPLFRRKFYAKSEVKKATIFISGLGHFELSVNGQKVGDHFLDPGWTKYDKQALYVTFDLTAKVKKGENVLGVILGNGFYFIPRDIRYRKLTGAFGYPKLICRLLLEYKDGSTENITSDEKWKTAPSPITYTSIYGGEDYNANLEQKNWDNIPFNEALWKQAVLVKGPPVLNSQIEEPLKIFENFKPKKVTEVKPGIWVYDMGQNASAIPAISVKGKRGDIIHISPAELLNADGTINQSASGDPHYYDYTLKGDAIEQWQPRFTYYGFRYIQIEGAIPEHQPNVHHRPVMIAIKSLHIRNAAENAGTFISSDTLFNKTFNLIKWAIKSNMVSILTDCPHREKLGWLEEAHLVGPSIQYNYNIAALCRKVIRDMIVSQTPEGLIPDIAPEYVQFDAGFRDSPEWGSNGVILPWYVYQWYGDKDVLKESYPMMQKYVAYLASKAKDHILSHGLGDWFDIGPGTPGEAQLTPKSLTATAIYDYDLDILSQIASVLNKADDAIMYRKLAVEVKDAFNTKFFNKETRQYSTGSQTANAMALYMKLVEPAYRPDVVNNLVKEIKGRNNRLTAGDIGYRYVLRALEEEGRSDVIFDMNSRNDVPGYGWQLAHGATALTESWQAYGFVSNNHFMLGHLMEWFYSGLAGIRSAKGSVGYHQIEIHPQPVGNITFVNATYHSMYGEISSSWKKSTAGFNLQVKIPANTSAKIFLPTGASSTIKEGGKIVKGVNRTAEGYSFDIGSGVYNFEVAGIR